MSYSSNLYPDIVSGDLREELHALLFGRVDIDGHGHPVLVRRLGDIPCTCFNVGMGSPTGGCPYCQDEGFAWTEDLQTMVVIQGVAPVYKPGFLATGDYPQTSYGYVDPSRGTAFCEFSVFPDYAHYTLGIKKTWDKLYELQVDSQGSLAYPVARSRKWKILDLTPIHGSNGRVEYIELSLEKCLID